MIVVGWQTGCGDWYVAVGEVNDIATALQA